jgi:uncharacterized membrane protein (DUF485 family)
MELKKKNAILAVLMAVLAFSLYFGVIYKIVMSKSGA